MVGCYSLILDEPNKEYCLEYDFELSHENYASLTISFGSFIFEGDTIVTTDARNDSKMKIRQTYNGSLVVEKGFSALVGMIFYFAGFSEIDYSPLFSIFVLDKFDKNKYRNQNYMFTLGKEYVYGIYCLVFTDEGEYYYTIKDAIISKGKYERQGNLLIFHDEGLNNPFYSIIKSEGIDGRYLPGGICSRPLRINNSNNIN